MAPSQVSGMKMRNLLFGVILGLLAVVHSAPVDTVTQIPTKAEDEVMREAVTDGFLVEHFSFDSLTTASPKGNTTVQASQRPSSDSTVSGVTEGSAGETSDASTTSVSLQFSTTTRSAISTDDSSSDSATTHSPQSSFTTSSEPNEAQSSITPDHISTSQTTDPAVSSFHFLSTHISDSGSGDGEMFGLHSTATSSMTSSSNTEANTASSSSTTEEKGTASSSSMTEASIASSSSTTEASTASSSSRAAFIGSVTFGRSEGSSEGSGEESGSGMEFSTVLTNSEKKIRVLEAPEVRLVGEPQIVKPVDDPEPQNKGHSTPGWIIIVGFVVGLAALVMIFVAIATRDKWNGPSQASQQVTNTNSTNQQRGLEMETFLHKDHPKENGKAGEYTVIPLDELPEKYSSH